MLLYVDDIFIAGKSRSVVDEVKAILKSEFEMKDLGAAKRLLGMDIRRDRSQGRLWLSQCQYVENVLLLILLPVFDTGLFIALLFPIHCGLVICQYGFSL